MWEILKSAYKNENAAAEMHQDCLDKFVASSLSVAVLIFKDTPRPRT